MTLFTKFGHWRAVRQERRMLGQIREHLVYFGCPVAGMSDAELKAGILKFFETAAPILRKTGLTTAEAAERLGMLTERLRLFNVGG